MKSPVLLPAFSLLACFALASCSVSVPPGPPPPHKVTVQGHASIKVVPDEMDWNMQVRVNDATLAAAKTRHDASLTAALDYLKSLGGDIKDLQTGGIRFDKQTYFPPDADKSKPFTCSTQVTFTLINFDKYGPVCDALAKIDGVEVNGVEYDYSKKDDVQRQALQQALQNAHDKASDLAATANCNLGAPLDIIEGGGGGPQPFIRTFAPMGAAAATPAPVAGQIEITGFVTATYDLGPK
jgi:uncharacterized protein YggE